MRSSSKRNKYDNMQKNGSTNNPVLMTEECLDLETQLCFARNGHAVLRNLFETETIRELHQQLREYSREHELDAWQQKLHVASSGGNGDVRIKDSCATIQECQRQLRRLLGDNAPLPFLQYFHTARTLPTVYALCRRLAPLAAGLLDVPSVRLYQDALFWKRAADGVTPWHVDARMAPFDTSHLVTLWVPLHDVDAGGLVFCSKSHADFALPYWNRDPETWGDTLLEERYMNEERGESLLVDYMPLAAGDVTAHHGWVLHCADPSPSGDRMALAVSFVDSRAPVRDDIVASASAGMTAGTASGDNEDAWSYRDWIGDVPPGCRDWDHPLVPIVWPEASPHLKNGSRKTSMDLS